MNRHAFSIVHCAVLLGLGLATASQASWYIPGSGKVTLADNDLLTFPHATAGASWSICAWVSGSNAGLGDRVLFSLGDPGTYQSFTVILRRDSASTARRPLVYYGSRTVVYPNAEVIPTGGDWWPLVIQRDGNTLEMFVAGSAITWTTPSSANMQYAYTVDAAVPFCIGNYASGTSETSIQGNVAEIAFWQTRALSDAEVAAYSGTGAFAGNPQQPDDPDVGGSPDWYCEAYDITEPDCDIGDLTVVGTEIELDPWSNPIVSGTAEPYAPTNMWPANGATGVTYRATLAWTKTPLSTANSQTFEVLLDTVNPPVTSLGSTAADVVQMDSGPLLPDTTYYWKVIATNEFGSTATSVLSFSTTPNPSSPATLYWVGPAATGDGDGRSVDNLMAWADVAASTEAGDVIRIVGPDTTIFNAYENGGTASSPVPYVEWPDRIYQSNTIIHHGIAWTLGDYRRIGRFINGDFWVVGPAAVVAYSPGCTGTGSSLRNGLMIDPNTPKHGLDGRGGTASFMESKNAGYDLPLEIDEDYPVTLLAGTSMSGSGPYDTGWTYLDDASILTVVETGLANNIWFRPSYHRYTGRTVEHQWSDVRTDLLLELPMNCTTRLVQYDTDVKHASGAMTPTSYEFFTTGPWLDLTNAWPGHHTFPWKRMPHYGAYFYPAHDAILALQSDQFTLAEKKKTLINCIQIGLDFGGIWRNRQYWWWGDGGGHQQGRYWMVLWAGIMLDDENLTNIGIEGHADDDTGLLAGYMHCNENDQSFRLTAAEGVRQGLWRWTDGTHTTVEKNATPWSLYVASIKDSTGTVTVEHGSTTVIGQAGDNWETLPLDIYDNPSYTGDDRDMFLPATYADGVWRIADDSQLDSVSAKAYTIVMIQWGANPPRITLDRPYEGSSGTTTFVIANSIYVGTQYNATNRYDLDEFDPADWVGKHWWSEWNVFQQYNTSSSTWLQENYQSLNSDEWIGEALGAIVLQNTTGAVTLWNSPSFFRYLDECRTNHGLQANGWVESAADTYWAITFAPPAAPAGLSPAVGATGQPTSTSISWQDGGGASAYDVWFGTSESLVTAKDESVRVLNGTEATSYDPPGDLDYGTTYYWLVRAHDDYDGTTDSTVANFRTRTLPKKIFLLQGGS